MSSHASTQDKSPDPSSALTIERKKTKVLKQALKQERKERAGLEQEFEKQKDQIVSLNNQLQEKVSNFPSAPSHQPPTTQVYIFRSDLDHANHTLLL